MKKETKYNIGLDIGTTSVGWAVVDTETNKLLRKGNKSLWGVRLFDEAITAEGRRTLRNTRRRYDRRRQRIKLLQDEFKDEINKVDPNFYTKLNESFYNKNDRLNKTIQITKLEQEQTKDYYDKYPTIYHLRNELIVNSNKLDIRLIYLAIHHIIKYRGNFLYEGTKFNINNLDIETKLRECLELLMDINDEVNFNLDDINYNNIEFNLINSQKNDLKAEIKKELDTFISKKALDELIKILCNYKFSINKLLNIELESKAKLSFNDINYDNTISKLSLEDNILEVINSFKELMDMLYLKKIFKNSENPSISSLMISKYNQHQEDLKYLKQLFSYNRNIYQKIFRTNNKYTCIYDNYIHNHLSYEDFIKELNKLLDGIWNYVSNQDLIDRYKKDIENRINNGEFLPRLTEVNNGTFPYQLNEDELNKIIENQGRYYPFILEKVDNEYKLVKLLKFRIPYYVGPLNSNSKFAWIKKYTNEIITPYNFDRVVDKESSALEFIERMLGKCTYLINEPAMANNSLACNEFKVLNELKQIKVNNQKLTNDFIQRTINELFKKESGTITDKKFKEYLYLSGEYDMYKGELDVKGYSDDKKFANNLNTYIDFYGKEGFFDNTEYTKEDAENIIRWITIFEDKSILKTKILKEYPLLNNNIDKIVNKKYKGWSNLSKKLITLKYYIDKKTGLKKSILDLMYETDENFMQILNNPEYKFEEMINEINSKTLSINKLNYNVVKELYTSPANRKGIWQSLLVVDEIVRYMGYSPTKITIEMARGDEKKQRTLDRKKYLTKIYEKCKDTITEYKRLKHELDSKEKIDSEKLFLYFIQEGKSLYSMKSLDIDKLNEYEVDHIIPQCLIKDDSIENKALVLREENQIKAANLVLPEEYRKNIKWWSSLVDKKLISSKKFYNLKRKEYSDKDIEGFINRQLVETRQITKQVANIFKNYYQDTKIIYLPARLSHDYREKFELFKYRDLNDYHHAHDAYLAAVLGQYKDKFKFNINFDKLKEVYAKLIENKEYNKIKYGYVIDSIDNEYVKFNEKTGEIRFDADEFNNLIAKTLYQNDILISKKTEINNGKFYRETKNSKNKPGVALKKNLSTKLYGSYTGLVPAYAVLVEYVKKGKNDRRMIGIPIYYDKLVKNDKNIIINYIEELLKVDKDSKIKILSNKIPFYITINWDNQICCLVGATDTVEVCNALEFKINRENQIKWKYALNRLFNGKTKCIDDLLYQQQLKEILNYVINKIETYYKLYNNLLEELKNMLSNDLINELNIEYLEKILKELFNLLKYNSKCANFKFLNNNYSMAFGKKNDRIIKSGTIINKSVTGIWEKHYEF